MRMNKTAFYRLLSIAGSIAVAAGPATALTLADLDAGASFTSLDGSITFQDFEVSLPATVGSATNSFVGLDLALIEVEALPTNALGFRVIEFDAPLVAVGEEIGQIVIDFRAVANSYLITGVNLRFTGTAIGTGAYARIDETVTSPGGSVSLTAIRQGGGAQQPTDADVLPTAAGAVDVSTTITLSAQGQSALLAQLSEFEPGFSARPIPEPAALAIFGGGFALVVAASRRRWI